MRTTGSANGVFVKAYAGSTGVLVAFDVDAERRKGLLGFALQRKEGNQAREWLLGTLHFPGVAHDPGQRVPTNQAPVQKFRWSDYSVFDGRTYSYTVHPVYGTPDHPDVQDGPTVKVRTASLHDGDHGVLFNRAAAASQAFSRKFPEVEAALNAARKAGEPKPSLPPEVQAWLSRGLDDEIVGYMARAADDTWALDIAIYEYELEKIVEAVNAAHQRGARVRVVYHAKKGDPQTHENELNLAKLPADCKVARVTSRIFHHKFALLSRIDASGARTPIEVLCGSTNFTPNGVYRQANVIHIARDPMVAASYLSMFEELFDGADVGVTRKFITQNNPVVLDGDPVFVGFSPRSKQGDLEAFIDVVNAAKRDVLFCTAFNLFAPLAEALQGAPNDAILRFGLQNSRSTITAVHRDRTARFVATALLNTGLEGFLKESLAGQDGRILIHTKLLITDFTSDHPTVISGSHNLSKPASEGNDENFLVLSGDTDVADCYGVELMRLYDHYRFRFTTKSAGPTKPPPSLTPDDGWMRRYFVKNSLNARDRLYFAGRQ
ncbi:MAG: phospholipase D-like domain-containing protein [Acidimicrobiales bacterium]